MFGKKDSKVIFLLIGTLMIGIGIFGWALMHISTQSIIQKSNLEAFKRMGLKQPLEMVQADISREALKPLYLAYPIKSEIIGTLTIPALEREILILEGTGDEELKLGVGHFTGSVLPGENDNSVLSGHRDTVFTKLDKLKLGDQLIVTTSAGTFTYTITGTRIVDKDDRTVIVPTDHAVLTLTTCYPFYFIGDAPERYIVSADLTTVVIKPTNID